MIVSRRPYRWPPLAFLASALAPASLAAQYVTPPPPAAYALQKVTIVVPDGRREGVNIVVRNGMIEAIGAQVSIPADAQLLEGDSLMVYPGFVDAQGAAKYGFPDPDIDRTQVASWAPPRSVQSFMPHRRVADYLQATGTDLEDSRKQGIVAAAVHAEGRLMPGRGVLLLARKDAKAPAELVVDPALGPAMSFQGAAGVYPSQVFAVMAFIRQSFEDARRDGMVRDAFSRDPQGLATPTWDPDYEVLREVADGAQPVFVFADGVEDIRNALRLADEYGFRAYIVGGDEAWKVAGLLSQRNVAVFVSLDFPEPERWKPDSEQATEGDAVSQEPEPLSPEAEVEKRRLEAMYANAGRLAEAGVTFALTSGGGKADLRKGARKAIEYGLSEDDALRALTTTPAELFGVPHVTQIQAGLPATFLVANGPLFDEETSIAYTFVEGQLERGEEPGAEGGEAPASDLTGSWDIVIDGQYSASMTVTQDGAKFSGTFTSDFGPGQVRSGRLSGNDVSFVISINMGGQSMNIPLSGTVRGDSASGTGEGPDGEFTWTATRKSGPGEEGQP